MRITKQTRNVTTGGIGEKQAFSIAASAQAFKILSDGLYSNKIQAIIRELCCNANDSHIAAKNKDPIEVHLPNHIEPWFAVRDWGTGLSHKDIMHLYTTYFFSTKDQSDDETGCLGLGSKSPFSYTDQFTVTSWFNGEKRLYSAYIDENGAPQIALMGKPVKTSERNSLEVKVAVSSEDFNRFADEASTVLGRFNPVPNVTGISEFTPDIPEYLIEGSCWKIRSISGYCDQQHPVAVQGSVGYPIDRHAIDGLSDEQKAILKLPIDIWFDLGELMITASRETLSYGDKEPTSESIKRKCDMILDELPKRYQNEFDQCKTLWEAKIRYSELIRQSPFSIRELASSGHLKIDWKGQNLDSRFEINPKDYSDSNSNPLLTINCFQFRGRYGRNMQKPRARAIDTNYDGHWTFHAQKNVVFFYDDLNRGAHSRISNFMIQRREAVRDGKTKNNEPEIEAVYLIKSNKLNLVTKLKRELGNAPIRKASELPKAPSNTVKGTRKAGVKVYKFTPKGYSYDPKSYWEPTQLDFSVGGVYVVINRYRVMRNGTEVSGFGRRVRSALDADLIDRNTPIYGVYPRYAKKLVHDPKWKSFWQYVSDQIDADIAKNNLRQALANDRSLRNFIPPGVFSYDLMVAKDDVWAALDTKSPMLAFRNIYKDMVDSSHTKKNKSELLLKAAADVGYTIDHIKPTCDLQTEWKKLERIYPMLTFVGSYTHSKESFSKVIDYIKLIDSQ